MNFAKPTLKVKRVMCQEAKSLPVFLGLLIANKSLALDG